MEGLVSLLAPSDIVTSQSDPAAYKKLTTFWAAQVNLGPQAIVAPSDSQTLGKVLKYLYDDTQLDFAFRGHGYSSMPTKDILLSMHRFDSFSYDPDENTITVGAGQHWLDVYEAIHKVAPKFTTVGARTPCVSVGGSIVTAGFSWLSGDLGCISDPQNMLDCEVVKYDGSVVWASQEPELLWAIRGGGGGFGAITKVIFKLHPSPASVFHGTIVAPRSVLPQAIPHLSRFSASSVDPGISVFMFIEKDKFQNMHDVDAGEHDALVFHVFDVSGKEHGRTTFKWALDLPGAQDFTKMGTILEVIRIQDRVAAMSGTSKQYWAPMIVPEFSERQLEDCVQWFTDLDKHGKTISDNTYMIFELFCTREGSDPSAMAWPGPRGCRHMLVIGVGCGLDVPAEEEEKAKKLAKEAPKLLMGDDPRISPTPNAIDEWTEISKIYGSNLAKVQELRARYDPKARFKAHVSIA
ncbi:FAD-linked oxidoreductase [Colletotrichum siamense]|nr:FAD-linked oxidoreductase [Colletotrichum siamense]